MNFSDNRNSNNRLSFIAIDNREKSQDCPQSSNNPVVLDNRKFGWKVKKINVLYHFPLVRKSTFQQIRLNSAQYVWISIKEEWADTFVPIIGRL